jgi:hypothetical protein
MDQTNDLIQKRKCITLCDHQRYIVDIPENLYDHNDYSSKKTK